MGLGALTIYYIERKIRGGFSDSQKILAPDGKWKKIPQMLLDRCEFGKTDYNLNIVRPPVYEDEEDCDE